MWNQLFQYARSLACHSYLPYKASLKFTRRYTQVCRPLILGIESTFDDTGVCVIDGDGHVLGEDLYSQRHHHVKTGGTVPLVAGALHEKHLPIVAQTALEKANLNDIQDIDVVALALGPGLGPCLRAGLNYTQHLNSTYNKPVIPVHHMEAHALMPRMISKIPFPYLVLLASGGHCMLLLAENVQRFRRLGNLLDDSPGDAFEKVARKMGLQGGGAEVEKLALDGDEKQFRLCEPLSRSRCCNFSFSGLRSMTERLIDHIRDEQVRVDPSNLADVAASFQYAAIQHLLVKTHRALLYCQHVDAAPSALVVSGGVACNSYLRKKMLLLCEWHQLPAHFPPPEYCTDNGRMIAWAGLEYLNTGVQPEANISSWRFKTPWPLGIDESASYTKRFRKMIDLQC